MIQAASGTGPGLVKLSTLITVPDLEASVASGDGNSSAILRVSVVLIYTLEHYQVGFISKPGTHC